MGFLKVKVLYTLIKWLVCLYNISNIEHNDIRLTSCIHWDRQRWQRSKEEFLEDRNIGTL